MPTITMGSQESLQAGVLTRSRSTLSGSLYGMRRENPGGILFHRPNARTESSWAVYSYQGYLTWTRGYSARRLEFIPQRYL